MKDFIKIKKDSFIGSKTNGSSTTNYMKQGNYKECQRIRKGTPAEQQFLEKESNRTDYNKCYPNKECQLFLSLIALRSMLFPICALLLVVS